MNFPTAAVWDMGTLTKGALEGGFGIPSRPLAFPMGPGNRVSVLPRLPDLHRGLPRPANGASPGAGECGETRGKSINLWAHIEQRRKMPLSRDGKCL